MPAENGNCSASTVVLVYEGSDDAELQSGQIQSNVTDPLVNAFTVVRDRWNAITKAGEAGRVVVAAPAIAAMGDPDRPMDSAVVGALISFVRSVAIELRKSGGSANTVLFEKSVSDRKCEALINVLINEPRMATGQEIFVTDGLDLGRLHP